MGVGGPRADFASLLLTFGARPASGQAKTTRNDTKITKKSPKITPKSPKINLFLGFSGSNRSLSAFGATLPRFGCELAVLGPILLHLSGSWWMLVCSTTENEWKMSKNQIRKAIPVLAT